MNRNQILNHYRNTYGQAALNKLAYEAQMELTKSAFDPLFGEGLPATVFPEPAAPEEWEIDPNVPVSPEGMPGYRLKVPVASGAPAGDGGILGMIKANPYAAGAAGVAGLGGAALLGRGAARVIAKNRGRFPKEVMAAISHEVMNEIIKEAGYNI